MARSIPLFLFSLACVLFTGCGGGDATDSDAVAENSSEATPAASGSGMAMSGGEGMGTSGGSEGMMGGMGAGMEAGMMEPGGGETMGAGMEGMEEFGSDGTGAGGDPAAMEAAMMKGFGAGGEEGAISGGDSAAMEAAMMKGFGAGGEEGATSGDPAEMEAMMERGGLGGTGGGNPEDMEAGFAGEGGIGIGGIGPGRIGGGAVAEKVPDDFEGKAMLAFRQGKDHDAMQYMYAHALTTEAGAEDLLPTIRWVKGLSSPKLAVLWGAGFVVSAPRNFSGDPKPIGTTQKIPTRGGNRGTNGNDTGGGGYVGGGGEADYGGGGGGGGQNSLLKKGAGELGEKLVASFLEAASQGKYGDVLKKANEQGSGGGRVNRGGLGGGGEGGLGGGGLEGMAGLGGGAGMRRPGGAAAAEDEKTDVTPLKPGLSLLGIGSQKELIGRARDAGIDALVIINMKLSSNPKTGLTTNESTLSLFETSKQKSLYKTRKLNNITVQKARDEGKEDGVERELGKLLEAIDANFSMSDLPTGLTAEIADKRVKSLATKEHENPLPILVEAKMYHARGLLSESALFEAYGGILGVDFGRMLATGTEEDKIKVLNQWLPGS